MFGPLYIKKPKNITTIPKKSTGAAGYSLSTAEEINLPEKWKPVVKIGMSVAIADRWYGRIATLSRFALKKHLDIGAVVVDKDYRGEIGVIVFKDCDDYLPQECVTELINKSLSKSVILMCTKLMNWMILQKEGRDLVVQE